MNENENINKIEETKQKLYDRNSPVSGHERHGVLHQVPHDVSPIWVPDEIIMKKSNQTTFFKKFFIGTVIFFVFAVAFAVYMFMQGSTSVSNDNIDITVLGNAFTEGGKELQIQVEVVNKNKANLELSNLIVEYPRGASDDATDVVRLARESIGTIAAGGRAERLFKATLYGDQGSVRNVKIKLEYHPAGSNAIFTKEKLYPVTINSSPISLLVDAPASTSPNQPVSFKVTASLNTTLPSEDTALSVSYPQGFVFDSAEPAPSSGNSIWSLTGLTPAIPLVITVNGHMVGIDGDEEAFHIYAGTKKAGQSNIDVVYNSFLQVINIVKPFLDARVVLNNNDVDVPSVAGGEKVNADVVWSNNLPSSISNAQIIAKITGNVIDKSKVVAPNGFYDSANDQIIWDRNSVPDLGLIAPGQTGRLAFSFTPVSLLGSETKISNPQVSIEVSIRGQQTEAGSGFIDVNNFSKKIVKISSDFQLANSLGYVSGSLPPRAESETRYKISWTLSNSTNPMNNAEARAMLPTYVKWIGRVSGNNENISYNDVTREVIWRIGNVSANTGFGALNREADFVIGLTPSMSQVGQTPDLIKDVRLVGTDAFTSAQVRSSRPSLNTFIHNDPTFKSGDERVIK